MPVTQNKDRERKRKHREDPLRREDDNRRRRHQNISVLPNEEIMQRSAEPSVSEVAPIVWLFCLN